MAIGSISLSLCAMVLAYFILGGFQRTIKDKIYNLKGHLEITKFDLGSSYDENPIPIDQDAIRQIDAYPFTDHIQYFAHKAGMLKTKEEVEGVLFKGVSSNFSLDRFAANMIEGRFVDFPDSGYSKEVVISNIISNKLKLGIGDRVTIYFVQNPPRFRRLDIVGIYETGLEEIDKTLVLGDIGLVQRMNNWPDTLIGGYEIYLKDADQAELAKDVMFEELDANLYVDLISDKYRQIFDWLELLDQNVAFILGIILFVACINMISILLILIMERTQMIGVLQALGATKKQVKRIFMYNGMQLVLKGLVIGNGLALMLAYLQDEYRLIPLDAANYYMHFVPIQWDFQSMIFVNLLTIGVVYIVLSIPVLVLSRIKPIAAIRFD